MRKISKTSVCWKMCIIIPFMLITLSAHSTSSSTSGNISKSNTANKTYFIQKQKSKVNIQKNFICINTNLISHTSFMGEGVLCIHSPKEGVTINLFDNSIYNLLIKQGGQLYLRGHLRIKNRLSIQNQGKIILGNFNLRLSDISLMDFNSANKIIKTGIGIVISTKPPGVRKTFLPYPMFTTPFYNEEFLYSLFQFSLKHEIVSVESINQKRFISVKTPPPKL